MGAMAIATGIPLNEASCRYRYTELACRKSEKLWGTICEACTFLDYFDFTELLNIVTSPN